MLVCHAYILVMGIVNNKNVLNMSIMYTHARALCVCVCVRERERERERERFLYVCFHISGLKCTK